jgi:dolichol-phosphate mannosyltransferase
MFSLVLPTYNEAESLPVCVERVARALEGREFEIIVADDDSPDRTWEVAEGLGDPRIRVLRRTQNRGLAPAVVDAFEIARGDRLGVMDADGQHDEAILPALIDGLDGHELVLGTRLAVDGSLGDWSLRRRFTSWAAKQLARWLLRVTVSDPMSGYFTLRREVFERSRLLAVPRGYKILLELLCLGRPEPILEVGFTFRSRHAGRSKLGGRVVREYLMHLWDLRRRMRRVGSAGEGANA